MRNELRQALEQVARRFRQVRFWVTLAACWAAWAVAGAVTAAVISRSDAGLSWKFVAGFLALAAATGLVSAALALRTARDRRWIARRIEAKHADLGTGLLAAVEEDAAAQGRLGFLQATVIRKALDHRRTHDWEGTVPNWKLRGSKLAHAAALAALIVASFNLAGQARSRRESGPLPPGAAAVASGVAVEPGNTEIERGTSLLVVARFTGPVPSEAKLVVEGPDEAAGGRVMTRSLEDPAFAGRVESVDADLAYRVEHDGASTESYRVTVFEYPQVVRTDARLNYPSYTSIEPKTVEDVRHVTAVEGTELTLLCRLNKPVATARLVDEESRAIDLKPDPADPNLYAATMTLSEPRRFKAELVDAEGRPNKVAAEIAVNVVRNKPAVVKVSRPARDVRVSPLEELSLAAKLDDDFGVVRHGVTYNLAGFDPKEVVLEGSESNAKQVEAGHLLDFESFAAAPDQLISYYFWAEDVGPDGEPRRTSGDMFFAEVRPFEEIFRQGQQPSASQQRHQQNQQAGGAAQQAAQLAESQKEIISATWNLIRRETAEKPSATFAADAKTVLESQESAIERAAGMADQLRDAASKSELDAATSLMNDAVKHLTEAADSSSPSPLQSALVAEQAAYQALLKLRDREFNVVRGQQQQGGGGGGGGGPSQQQLQQLELSNAENRYEERRSAQTEQSQEDAQQREARQVLNRLKELARRQEDLNERLKELRSALEAAKDEQEREELERQLKRLRDQEQQILRDTDELRERMEREENRERMAEPRRQVEESRERVRQASEALEQGRVSQALTEGTRAERQLNDLSEELRKESSNRFSEEMTEMRDEARRLDEAQDQLSRRLESAEGRQKGSLRGADDRQQIREGLDAQQKRLEQLLEHMRRTVQEAEEPEPMLAEKLFDTVRETERRSIPDALEAADRLTDLGVTEEAAKASRDAAEGFDRLREGIEEAAESVLGDETEALKRAEGELEELADQIDRELGRPDRGPQADTRDGGDQGEQTGSRTGEQSDREDAEQTQGQGNQSGERRPAGGQDSPGEPGRLNDGEAAGEQSRQPAESQGESQGDPEGGPGGGQEGQRGQQGQQNRRQGGSSQGVDQPGSTAERRELRGPRSDGQAGARRGSPNGELSPGFAPGGLEDLLDGGAGIPSPGGPITGEGFREWSDRMRDVEELLSDPDLRAEAARIRDRARGAREEFKRHSKEPDPGALKTLVAEPLRELRERVAEEVRRRESPDSLVPIDRDPVPPMYAEGVRRYYERLGTGR